MGHRVTSRDVAAESGVSQATVARVFSSPELVAEATAARVRSAADRLGYVPNAIARSLKSQRTDIVGAVVPAQGEYWQHVVTSLSRRLAVNGRQLLLFSFADAAGVADALAAVRQYRLDGVVLASANIAPAQLLDIDGAMPVVAFNQPAASGVVPSVSVDNETGARAVAEHLVAVGVTAVTFVGGVAEASTDRQRYRGAAEALAAHAIACPYVEAGGFDYDAGYKAARTLLDGELPEAVMVAGDELALGVIDGLATAGVAVPDETLVTGFDGLPQAAWAGYDLTTVVQPVDLLVERAIDLLLDPADLDRELADVVVEGSLRIGRTTRRTHV